MARTFWSFSTTLVLAALALAAGCGGSPGAGGQREIVWTGHDVLFLADARNGQVRVFDLRNGPVPRASVVAQGRRSVQDMELDPGRGILWVLGDDALYRYDAYSLALQGRQALPTNTGPLRALELDRDGVPVLLVAGLRIRLPLA